MPAPEVPADNPMTADKVTLGRVLFYDFQLSINGARSCGICHEQPKGFTDGFVKAVGAFGDRHARNTPTVLNVAWRTPLTWLDPELHLLEEQLLGPLTGTEPIELGMGDQEDLLLDRLETFEPYPALFDAAWPDDPGPITIEHLGHALASFERTLIGLDSPYDGWLSGESDALSAAAQRGLDLFSSPALHCSECHAGPLLDRPLGGDGEPLDQAGFYNTGQYDVDGLGSYPPDDPGLIAVTGVAADMGAFRTPSLRSVADTPPYNHDGTTDTLADLLDNYARGGRAITGGDHPGDGADNPYKDPRVAGFPLTDGDKDDLLAFLEALSDPSVLEGGDVADPFCRDDDTGQEDCIEPRDLETDDVER
jgi:cytochrome c peroxidase